VLAVVAEELCDGTAEVWRQKLQRSSLGGSRSDQDGVYLSASWSFRVLKMLETVKIF
jgi:hypothetical protein